MTPSAKTIGRLHDEDNFDCLYTECVFVIQNCCQIDCVWLFKWSKIKLEVGVIMFHQAAGNVTHIFILWSVPMENIAVKSSSTLALEVGLRRSFHKKYSRGTREVKETVMVCFDISVFRLLIFQTWNNSDDKKITYQTNERARWKATTTIHRYQNNH